MKTSKVLACIGMLALGLTVCDAVAVGQNRRVSRPTSRTINRSTTSTTTTTNNNTTQHYATVADYLRSTEYRSKERAVALVEATSERLQKVSSVTDVPMLELSKEVIPYVIGIIIVLLLCTFIPPLCTWLPSILV